MRKFFILSNLGGNKAPGSYGFPMAFWKFCWDFVKSEIMDFLRNFSLKTFSREA